jgi:ferredoxin-NADP reductase
MTETQYFLIFLPVLLVLGVLMFMYLEGHFSYTDHVVEQTRYKVTKHYTFTGAESEEYVYRIIIRRDWHSGKVEYLTKEVKA